MATAVAVHETERRDDWTRRNHVATAVFGTWVIAGLFLDGWAHVHDKPEDFFSPWHAVLYSGFLAGTSFGLIDRWRQQKHGVDARLEPSSLIGLALFAAGGLTDMVWHEIFGVEVDLEALLSPTHLLLMVGGLFLLSGPIRWGLSTEPGRRPTFRAFLPTVVTLTLATALVSFFLMFLSAFIPEEYADTSPTVVELTQMHGIASVLITNALLVAPMLVVLRHVHPPRGTFTILFSGVALLMAGLEAFDYLPLAIPAIVGGATADAVIAWTSARTARHVPIRAISVLVPVVLWMTWFGIYDASYGLDWPVELWTGGVVLSALSGVGLGFLARSPIAQRVATTRGES